MELKNKAGSGLKTIVFPEGQNPVIQRAAVQLNQEGLIKPILVGSEKTISAVMQQQNLEYRELCIVDPEKDESLSRYIASYSEERQMPEAASRRIIMQPLCYSAMMVKAGRANGMVAGIDHPTEEVIMVSELILGLREGVSVPSSFYLVEIPGYKGPQDELLIFSDPSMNPDPSSEDLADITYATALSARVLFDWEPKAALLSFSTKGSAEHPRVDKVRTACDLLVQRNCDFLFDGELQADAATNPMIGEKKTKGCSSVAGKANILIFPDLDSCNIASKLVQQLAGARLYGPILQGFRFPVSDLSRGASIEDVIGSALLVAAF
jgi:Phosphotransacetylase